MGMTVTWDLDPTAVKYRIYRDTKAFTPGSLPTDVVEVLKDAVVEVNGKGTHEYDDAVRQTVYHLMFCVEDATGNTSYSERTIMGYFPESGPGPTELLRGNWEFGYFGEVPTAELPSYLEIVTALKTAGSTRDMYTANPASWNKCVVNGRIIYIPSSNSQLGAQYNGGVSYFASLKLDGSVKLRRGDAEFSIRAPSAHTGYTGISTITKDPGINSNEIIKSELGMVLALMVSSKTTTLNAVGGALPSTLLSLGDYENGIVHGSTIIGNDLWCVSGNGTTITRQSTTNQTIYARPILELLF